MRKYYFVLISYEGKNRVYIFLIKYYELKSALLQPRAYSLEETFIFGPLENKQ